MFSKCSLVPEKVQAVVNAVADSALVKKIEQLTIEVLQQINDLIKCTLGIDLELLLKYLVLIAALLWLIDTVKSILSTYLCWFSCGSTTSSCSSSSKKSSSSKSKSSKASSSCVSSSSCC